MFQKRHLFTILMLGGAATLAAQQAAPERIDAAFNTRLRTVATDSSRLMWVLHNLTDVYGPRPTGSPNHKAAADWAVKTMTSWGMKNAHLEPFTWRGIGWLPGKAWGVMTAPTFANLKFEAKPWAPGIKGGTIAGEVIRLSAPVNPSEAELDDYLTTMAPKVKGGIVMMAAPVNVPVSFAPIATRECDGTLRQRFQGIPDSSNNCGQGSGRGRGNFNGAAGGGRGRGGAGAGADRPEGALSPQQVNARLNTFVRDNMPGLLLTPQGGGRIPGEIVAQNGAGQVYDEQTPQPPAIIMRTDDYNRLWRIIDGGLTARVEVHMENTYYPDGKTSYVTVGEIPGSDKADEVVMMGGHLDSWTSATGGTDNGIGSAIMLEAARVLQSMGVKPRRTIRVALWSGEEQGEYGSSSYVAEHFGTAANPKPEWNKLVAYWNIDEGTGRVRGATVLGPPAAASVMSQIFKPFEDLGIYGAEASRGFNSSSDNDAFTGAGLPGIGPVQDGIAYNSTTWHSNLDTYDRIIPQDAIDNVIITASLMYHLATRDEMLPRFSADTAATLGRGGRGGGFQGAGNGGRGRGGVGAGGAAVAPPPPTAEGRVFATNPGVAVKESLISAVTGGGRGGAGGRGGVGNATPLSAALGSIRPAHGQVQLGQNGAFTYTPTAGYVGTDKFTYTLSRGEQKSAEATVIVVISRGNPSLQNNP